MYLLIVGGVLVAALLPVFVLLFASDGREKIAGETPPWGGRGSTSSSQNTIPTLDLNEPDVHASMLTHNGESDASDDGGSLSPGAILPSHSLIEGSLLKHDNSDIGLDLPFGQLFLKVVLHPQVRLQVLRAMTLSMSLGYVQNRLPDNHLDPSIFSTLASPVVTRHIDNLLSMTLGDPW